MSWRGAWYELDGLLRYCLWPETGMARALAPVVVLLLPLFALLAIGANRNVDAGVTRGADGDLADGTQRGSWEERWVQARRPFGDQPGQ